MSAPAGPLLGGARWQGRILSGGWVQRERAEPGRGSHHGGAQANLEAFTETPWVTVRGDRPQYPF